MSLYPKTPYIFSVQTMNGIANVEIEATEYDAQAPLGITGSLMGRFELETALDGAVGLNGYAIGLESEAPCDIRAALIKVHPLIRSFSVEVGYVPDDLPDEEQAAILEDQDDED